MDLETFITAVFCVTDDFLAGQKVRQRGPKPLLADSAVLTIEVVGEFLGLDTDRAICDYFRRHHAVLFPRVRAVHRTTFARQAAHLWAVKLRLWHHLAEQTERDEAISIIDSTPVPVCRFARAKRCRRFGAEARFGYDELARQTFYGLRAHLRITWPGVITAVELTPANVSDLAAAPEVLAGAAGWALGDRNYWSPALAAERKPHGLLLLAPFKTVRHEKQPWPRWLVQTRQRQTRQRIETVLGQLAERYHAKRVWARDRWHLTSRWLRKILSHTTAIFLCQQAGLDPLSFAELLTE